MEIKEFVEGKHYYLESGKIITTELFHKQRGYCCGNKCRHCPYEPQYEQGTKKIKEKESQK